MTAEKFLELFESEARASLKRKNRFEIDQDAIDNEVERTVEYLFKMKSQDEE
jgi:hypothetical protein